MRVAHTKTADVLEHTLEDWSLSERRVAHLGLFQELLNLLYELFERKRLAGIMVLLLGLLLVVPSCLVLRGVSSSDAADLRNSRALALC